MDSNKKKSIAFVNIYHGRGGSERVMSILAEFFANEGHKVKYIALEPYEYKYLTSKKIEFACLNFKKTTNVRLFFHKCKRLREELKGSEIIVVFCFRPIALVVFSSFGLGKKLIFSERNDPGSDPNTVFKRKIRDICYLFADKVVFQTEEQKNCFGKIIKRKGVVIKNPIKCGLPKYVGEHNEVISVCRLEKQKNIKMAIDAFELFYNNHREYTYSIYGDGTLHDELYDYIKSKRLEKAIFLKDFDPNIHERMAAAKMYVSSSDYEGVSNSMLEALGIGVPAICTDCPAGGARNAIENGVNGFLVERNDYNMMARYMSMIADDRELRLALSENASKILEKNSADNILNKWQSVIDCV